MNKKQYNYIQKKIAQYQEKEKVVSALGSGETYVLRGRISALKTLLRVMEVE